MHFRTIYKRVQRVILDCFSFPYCTLLLAKKTRATFSSNWLVVIFFLFSDWSLSLFRFWIYDPQSKSAQNMNSHQFLAIFSLHQIGHGHYFDFGYYDTRQESVKEEGKKNLSTVSVVITSGPIDSKLFMSSFTGPVYTT